jgi:hypothetical protein
MTDMQESDGGAAAHASTNGMSPLAEPVAEGERIAAAATEEGVPVRLLGGVAVALLCPSAKRPPLQRRYADIDIVTLAKGRDQTAAFLEGLGYTPDREFNMLHGNRRMFFWDSANDRQLDVFVDQAQLCHQIDFRARFAVLDRTLSLADLLLMKLQVVETNEKDYLDVCAILADHDLSTDDTEVNTAYLASLAAEDWGLWRTLGMVAEGGEEFARELDGFERGDVVAERLHRLRQQLDEAPKSRRWKLRARIGDRKRWYELPEEAH